MSGSDDIDCYSPTAARSPVAPGEKELIYLRIRSNDSASLDKFELQYPTHSSRCVLAKAMDADPLFLHKQPLLRWTAELLHFSGCEITPELDSWITQSLNAGNCRMFNVSDWMWFAYVSANGQVQPYVAEEQWNDGSTFITPPSSPVTSSASSGSSVESSPSDKDIPWMSLASVVSPHRSKTSPVRKKIATLSFD